MALTKHQKLARAMGRMLKRIDRFYDGVEKWLDQIQFHFHEPYLIVGRPLLKERAMNSMMRVYSIGLSIFSPKSLVDKWIGVIVTPAFYQASKILISQEQGGRWFIPWAAQVNSPSIQRENLQILRFEALLYCPAEAELCCLHEWEGENEHFSITNQFHLLLDASREHTRLKANLAQPAFEYFKAIVEKWDYDNFFGKRKYPDGFHALSEAIFAPKRETSIALAYEAILSIQIKRQYRNYSEIIQIWKKHLENLMFMHLGWTKQHQDEFLRKWKQEFLKSPPKIQKYSTNRWKSADAIDRSQAAQFIYYFVNRFISVPHKQFYGHYALVLMILVWVSRHPKHSSISLDAVVSLNHSQVDTDLCAIQFNDLSVEISEGLSDLLLILKANNTQKNSARLFGNLTVDRLEDALKRASKELLDKDTHPISPAAFLNFPHSFYGKRISVAQRRALSMGRQIDQITCLQNQILHFLNGKSSF